MAFIALLSRTPRRYDRKLVILIPAAKGEYPDNRSHTICYILGRLKFQDRIELVCLFPRNVLVFHSKLWDKVKSHYPRAVEFQPLTSFIEKEADADSQQTSQEESHS